MARRSRLIPAIAAFVALGFCAVTAPAAPAYNSGQFDSTAYGLGTHALNVIFVESDGSIEPSTEDWSAGQITKVESEVAQAVDWWESQTSGYHVNARLDLQVNYRTLETGYEPISHWLGKGGVEEWIDEVMISIGYTDQSDHDDRVRQFNRDQVSALGTNWSSTLFVVNDLNDEDNKFSDGTNFAWTWDQQDRPYSIMTYENGPYGADGFDRVLAHELAHHYYALDEYFGSGERNNEYSGYLDVINGNASRDADGNYVEPPEGTDKLMQSGILESSGPLPPSSFTAGQIGHVDTDGDGVPDVLDTVPLLSGDDTASDSPSGTFRFSGQADVNPSTNLGGIGTGANLTINWIAGGQYNLDGEGWVDFTPTDGTGDGYSEQIDLELGVLAPGEHAIDIRARNSVDNTSTLLSYTFTSTVGDGDTDGDGDVDLADFNTVRYNWGTGDTWSEGDFDGNGTVDLADFNTVRYNWGGASVLGAPGDIDGQDECELIVDIITGDVWITGLDSIVAGYQITSASNSLEPGDIVLHFESQPSLTTGDITDANLFAAGVAVPPDLYLGDIWNTSGLQDLVFSWTDDRNFTTVENADVQYVPEPATMVLLGIGGLGLAIRKRRA